MGETPFGAASKAVQTALMRNISPKKDYIIDNIKDILREGGLASGFCPAALPSLQSSLTVQASKHASIQKAPFALKEESRVVTSGSLPHCCSASTVVFDLRSNLVVDSSLHRSASCLGAIDPRNSWQLRQFNFKQLV